MTDFTVELISKLEIAIPELKNKVQAAEDDLDFFLPYVAYTIPQEVPVHTSRGIAGYNTLFEIVVYHSKSSEIEQLKHQVIKAIDGESIAEKRCYFKSGASRIRSDVKIPGYIMTFKIVNT